jgi:uncharacterized NAD-dependent epimerase/dehydratase family protein
MVILAESRFSPLESKTANQAIRYLPGEVVAVIDSRQAGATAESVLGFGGDIPVRRDLRSSLPELPDTLLVGIAPTGGILPAEWRAVILEALGAGLHVVSGLHTYLSDDPEMAAAARARGVTLTDLRKVPAEYEVVAKGNWRAREAKTILTVGTDCNVGKMTASLELHREFLRRGLDSAFVATGQTGILLSGAGVAVDSVLSDFIAGAIERELDRAAAAGHRYLHVEGQGSVTHQGYSGVTLGLLHGVMPDAMILVHHPARGEDDYGLVLDQIPRLIALHESLLAPFKRSKVVGIAVNSVRMAASDIASAKAELRRQTGLPVADVLTEERSLLAEALVSFLEGAS